MKIYCNSYRFVVSGLPDNCIVEFFGQIDKERFFVIFSLESGEQKAYVGPADALVEVRVDRFIKSKDATVVATEAGKFFFPDVCDWQKEVVLFNCRVIEIIPWTERIN